MDGKIVQYICDENYEAVLTDEGNIYERWNSLYSTGSMYKSRKWTDWEKKSFKVRPQ